MDRKDLFIMTKRRIYNLTLQNGGLTLSKRLKVVDFSSGYQVSKRHYETKCKISYKDFKKFFKVYKKIVKGYKNSYIGLWVDNDILYFDISNYYAFINSALIFGFVNNQKAIFDWSTKESIYLVEDL